ncbi:MAG: BrnT family toxin [Patescibacteria group bacterium]
MKQKLLFENVKGFDWDDGNIKKNKIKHKVDIKEAERIFFNKPLIIIEDEGHSQKEKRHIAFGKTDKGRLLIAAFTIRDSRFRIISVRDQNKRERRYYDKAKN